jgi:NAD(P)-dependent dehydrogenase (short-subunit alcohol dehydrogenase family)
MGDGDQREGQRRLAGRRCIVTGSARGIGEEIASAFHREGAAVALLDVDPAVKDVADRIGAAGTVAAVETLIAGLGGIDVLVNNAGILRLTPLLDISVDEWDEVQRINTRSMLVTTQVAARAMIAAGGPGKIINMASMAVKRPAANHAHYAASKAAVVALTQSAAVELGPFGITANAICPGFVLTDMGAATRTSEMVAEWEAMSPLGRLAERSDVAAMAVFLASDDGDYCTGQAMNVAGGMVMH